MFGGHIDGYGTFCDKDDVIDLTVTDNHVSLSFRYDKVFLNFIVHWIY